MEYTVGSVADLISGNKTTNKVKVVKRKFNQVNVSGEKTVQERPENVINTNYISKNAVNRKAKVGKGSSINSNFKDHKNQNRRINVDKDLEESNITVIDHTLLERNEAAVDTSEADCDDGNQFDSSDDETSSEDDNLEESNDKNTITSNTKDVNSRTIFVGNVPVAIKKRQILRFFFKFGKVQSVRLRCIAPSEPGISKRVAAIKKLIHPKRLTMHSYVTFEKREDALKAVEINGTKFQGHHLRIQICDDSQKPDSSKAIFLGNLPFDIEDEELWEAFESCGSIGSVRIVRDAKNNMGIGVAYVNFKSADSVELALQMGPVSIRNKEIRIQRYIVKKKTRNSGSNKATHNSRRNKDRTQKTYTHSKHQKNVEKQRELNDHTFEAKQTPPKSTNVAVDNGMFQGMKSSKKKKQKVNKGLIEKMKLKQKIAPK